jgi:hypothetical protein
MEMGVVGVGEGGKEGKRESTMHCNICFCAVSGILQPIHSLSEDPVRELGIVVHEATTEMG